MKLKMPTKVSAVFLMAALLAAGLIAAGGSASAQTDDTGSPADAVAAEAVSDTGGAGVAAVPMDLPLSESDLVGSVMYRRSGEFERFDTDHDIDPPSGISGASGASGASDTSEDREVVGSHYLLGDIFNVRVPASYAGKPGRVFAFSFNHIVLQSGDGHFTADCDNQRVFAYKDSGAARWRCDLDFGNSASGWAEATASAAQVSIAAAWSDEGCSNGEYGIETGNKEPLLVADCEALLAVKHHWLDEHPENRDGLKSKHALRSWGSGDIEGWEGVEVGGFHMTETQFKDNCDKDVKPECPRRVLGVRLPVYGEEQVRKLGRIGGGIPVELGGVGNAGSGDCARVGPVSDSGFAGVGCGLGALRILDLRGNALSGGIPWQLGNANAAPCGGDVATPELDLLSSITVVLFVLGLLAVPFTAGASVGVTLGSLGLTAGAVGLFVDVDISLGEYLFGCRVPSGALSRQVGSVESGGGGGEVSFDRARFPRGYSGVELAGRQRSEDGRAMFSGVLLGVGGAGVALAGVDSDELIEINVSGKVRKVSAGVIQDAARAAGYVGALSDVIDIVSGLFKTAELEFLHLDRSQLQFLDLSGNNDLPGNNPGNKLSGPVPVEIGNLDSLEYLDLSDNELSGTIPGNAGRGARPVHDRLAYFDASNNDFIGGVPPLLSTRLRVVDFSSNELGGSVPPSWVLLFGLEHLDLSSTGLSGELPAFIAGMNYLGVLYLNDNNLSGTVPSRIGEIYDTDNLLCQFLRDRWPWRWGESLNWLSPLSWLLDQLDACTGSEKIATDQLWDIDISNNLFHGEIPDNLGNLPILDSLDLRHNCFVGDVPRKLLDKSTSGGLALEYEYNLLASNTMLTSAACAPCFDGTYLPANAKKDLKEDCATLLGLKNHWGESFPYRWGEAGQKEMSSWRGVSLSGNRVAGLELSDLGLSGTVPDSLAGLDSLTSLRLGGNRLTGGIPVSLRDLEGLRILDLSDNELTGQIPSGLWMPGQAAGYFPYLERLDLSRNKLSGEIPFGFIETLRNARYLNLSRNRFTGPIPLNDVTRPPAARSLLGSDYLFQARLNDELGLADLAFLEQLDLSHNFLTGKIPKGFHLAGYSGYYPVEEYQPIRELRLNDNCLTGTVPEGLTTLAITDISNNDLDYTGWRGAGGTARKGCIAVGCSTGELVDDPSSNAGLVSDCEVLLELSEHWSSSAAVESWGTDSAENINSWKGVTITDKRVAELELPNKELSGNIPEQISKLSHLHTLDLSGNTLTEEIPESLRYLASLQTLNLSDNSLSGPIPEELSDLASLRTLDLHKNQLTGSIPASLGRLTDLKSLKLQINSLTGAIPEELAGISGLSSIGDVNLSRNCLLGPVPARLAGVVLAGGNLFGTENDNSRCGDPCSDGTFVLSATPVSWSVPASPLVDDCRALWATRKHFNAAGTAASSMSQQWGTTAHRDIATWPGVEVERGRVAEVNLAADGLRGTVPAVLGDLDELEVLNLSRNLLRGTIPAKLSELESVKTLNLSRNFLSGPVPASFSWLESLVTLNLSHNRLTGQIPSLTTSSSPNVIPTIARPKRLERLLLNDNQFEGIIPPQITSHANLKALRLSNNNLHGPIPASIVSLRLLSDLRLNDNNLTGPAPKRLERMINLRYLYLQNNCLTGQDPGPTFRIAFIYYTNLSISLGGLPIGISSLPAIKTQNNLFDNAATENKTCGQICRESVANPSANTELVRDCERLLEIRDNWAARTTLPEGSAMATWGSGKQAGSQHRIDRWQGVTIKNNRVAGLDLSGHFLTSPVPTELTNLKALTSLNLSNNQLSSFPTQVIQLEKLQDLNLGRNQIATLPANIANLEELASLNLSYNDIADLPTSISELELLTDLNLAANNLSRSRTSTLNTITTLKSLARLNLSSNSLAGSVPSSFRNLTDLTHLDLSRNGFSGHIPTYISTLTELQDLNMSNNRLFGYIPNAIGNLRNLEHLNLWSNNLSGSIPSAIGNLQNLKSLDLGRNRLSGSIPPEIGNLRNLEILHLFTNNLSGRIPTEIGNLHNLQVISIVATRISGPIPPSIGNLRNLIYLSLFQNRLHGPIPSEIGNLRNLKWVRLFENDLSGTIPSEIGNLRNLERLDLSRNSLYGSIPSEIGNLRNLKYLYLMQNFLSSPIPQEIGNLRNLEYLSLSRNALYGSIPSEISNLLNLKRLDLSGNYLYGSIPLEIENLRNLEILNLSSNDLYRSIPKEVGNLRNLKNLSLSSNSLSGPIPSEIGNLRNLEGLELSSNRLNGSIPTEIGNLRNLKRLYLSDNNLSGTIPSEIGSLRNLEYLWLSSNSLSGAIPSEIGNLRNLTSLWLFNNDLCGPIPSLPSRIQRIYIYLGNSRLRSPCL